MKKSNKIEFVSVVVPVYNEEGCLQELIDRTLAALDGCNRRFEFIMVDDGSRDNSAEIMKEASRKRPGEVISCILNRNYGSTPRSWRVFRRSAATWSSRLTPCCRIRRRRFRT